MRRSLYPCDATASKLKSWQLLPLISMILRKSWNLATRIWLKSKVSENCNPLSFYDSAQLQLAGAIILSSLSLFAFWEFFCPVFNMSSSFICGKRLKSWWLNCLQLFLSDWSQCLNKHFLEKSNIIIINPSNKKNHLAENSSLFLLSRVVFNDFQVLKWESISGMDAKQRPGQSHGIR